MTNEADARENVTKESTLAALGDGVRGFAMTTGLNDGDDIYFRDEIDRQKPVEWTRPRLVRMVALRAEGPPNVNEEIRKEAKEVARVCREDGWTSHSRQRGLRC